MIIRIGDERRSLLDEHLGKLKDLMLSGESMQHHRQLAVESYIAAATNLPHKVYVYGALLALIAADTAKNGGLHQDIVNRVVEHL